MNRTTAYATAVLLTASGLLLGAHATYPVLDLMGTALAQASGGSSGTTAAPRSGTTGATSTTSGAGGLSTNSPNAGSLNTTQPGAGVHPYPGTNLGTTTPQGPAQSNPALTTPRAGEVPPAPGATVDRSGRPCSMSGTTAPNANVPSC